MRSIRRCRARSRRSAILLVAAILACVEDPGGPDTPKPEYTLTLATTGAGTGSLVATPAAAKYLEGTTVSITAAPATGSAFVGWKDDCAASATNPCTVSMTANKTVTGVFTPPGIGQFDGEFAGQWSGSQSSGANLTGPLALTIGNGVIQGTLGPISGSRGTFTGTVSASGAVTATIGADNNGCSVNLAGQMTTSLSNGITQATATGTYTLIPTAICNPGSGSWTVTRR